MAWVLPLLDQPFSNSTLLLISATLLEVCDGSGPCEQRTICRLVDPLKHANGGNVGRDLLGTGSSSRGSRTEVKDKPMHTTCSQLHCDWALVSLVGLRCHAETAPWRDTCTTPWSLARCLHETALDVGSAPRRRADWVVTYIHRFQDATRCICTGQAVEGFKSEFVLSVEICPQGWSFCSSVINGLSNPNRKQLATFSGNDQSAG